MNEKFEQLLHTIATGEYTLTQIQVALILTICTIRTAIRQRIDIPEGIKDLLAGGVRGGTSHIGLVKCAFMPIQELLNTIECIYSKSDWDKNINRFSKLMNLRRTEDEEKEYQTLLNKLEGKNQFEATETERLIEKAIIKTLEDIIGSKPKKDVELLMRKKLKKILNK